MWRSKQSVKLFTIISLISLNNNVRTFQLTLESFSAKKWSSNLQVPFAINQSLIIIKLKFLGIILSIPSTNLHTLKLPTYLKVKIIEETFEAVCLPSQVYIMSDSC